MGKSADRLLRSQHELVSQIRAEIGQSEDLVRDIRRLMEERKSFERQVEKLQRQQSRVHLNELFARSTELEDGIQLVGGEIPHADMDLLKQLGYEALEKEKEATVTVLGARDEPEGKVYVAAAVTGDLIRDRNLKAGTLVGALGRLLGGGGGGQPDLATAGGRKPEKLNEMFDRLPAVIKEELDKA